MIRRHRAVCGCQHVVTRLCEQRVPAVGEQDARRDRSGVELAQVRLARADRIDVRAGRDPVSLQNRLCGAGRGHDNARSGCRFARRPAGLHRRVGVPGEAGSELLGPLPITAGNPDLTELAGVVQRPDMRPRLDAGADDGKLVGIRPGQQVGRDYRDGCGPYLRHRRRVQQSQWLAGRAAGQQDHTLVRVQSGGRIAGVMQMAFSP